MDMDIASPVPSSHVHYSSLHDELNELNELKKEKKKGAQFHCTNADGCLESGSFFLPLSFFFILLLAGTVEIARTKMAKRRGSSLGYELCEFTSSRTRGVFVRADGWSRRRLQAPGFLEHGGEEGSL